MRGHHSLENHRGRGKLILELVDPDLNGPVYCTILHMGRETRKLYLRAQDLPRISRHDPDQTVVEYGPWALTLEKTPAPAVILLHS